MSEPNTVVQLKKLLALLPDIIKEVGYSELYGFDLTTLPNTPEGTVIRDRLLTKFLAANKFVIDPSAQQLKKTLAWRKEFNPLSAAFLEKHDPKFDSVGVVTSVPLPKPPKKPTPPVLAAAAPKATTEAAKEETTEDAKETADESKDEAKPETAEAIDAKGSTSEEVAPEEVKEAAQEDTAEATEAAKEEEAEEPAAVAPAVEEPVKDSNLVVAWNLYGTVKNRSEVFGDLENFLRWRVGEMERGISKLDFTNLETSYMPQVHDYYNVSFLRLDSATKASSKATIELFQSYYPEILNVKYFVNVPTFMSWMFSLVKFFVSKETFDKFRLVSNGSDLAKTAGLWVPKQYGGSADSLTEIAVTSFEPINPELVHKYVKPEKKAVTPTPAASAPAPAAGAAPVAEQEAAEAAPTTASEIPSETAEPKTEAKDVEAAAAATKTAETPEVTTAAKEAEVKTAEPAEEVKKEVPATTTAAPADAEVKTAEPAEEVKTEVPTTTTAAAADAEVKTAESTEKEVKTEVPAPTTADAEESKTEATQAEPGATAEAAKPTATA